MGCRHDPEKQSRKKKKNKQKKSVLKIQKFDAHEFTCVLFILLNMFSNEGGDLDSFLEQSSLRINTSLWIVGLCDLGQN